MNSLTVTTFIQLASVRTLRETFEDEVLLLLVKPLAKYVLRQRTAEKLPAKIIVLSNVPITCFCEHEVLVVDSNPTSERETE